MSSTLRDLLNKARAARGQPAIHSEPQPVPPQVKPERQDQSLPQAQPQPQRRKGEPVCVGYEQITAKCGHVVVMPLWESSKDRFRDGRRNNIVTRLCPECRRIAHETRTAAEQKIKAEKKKRKRKKSDRLPDGSKFTNLVWNEADGMWSGTLEVPGHQPITSSHTAIIRLILKLDIAFRKAEVNKLVQEDQQLAPENQILSLST